MKLLTSAAYTRRGVQLYFRAGVAQFPAVPEADHLSAAQRSFDQFEAGLRIIPKRGTVGEWQRIKLRAHRASACWEEP